MDFEPEKPPPSTRPLDVDDAKRALSVRLFLALFVPAAVAIGGVEVNLLVKTGEIASGVQHAQASADDMDRKVTALADDVKALRETDVPDLKTKIAVLSAKLDEHRR
jgi:outer membrane murein-binding lipoprotein Lpp